MDQINPWHFNPLCDFDRVVLLALLVCVSSCRPLVTSESIAGTGATDSSAPVVLADEDRSGCVVTAPPEELGFDSFYEKYCDADGIPVISSGEVDDLALQQAYYIITNMLAPIPDVREELVIRDAYFAIMGVRQFQTTLPEYSHMDSDYWDQRARGLGGSRWNPVTSGAEENLLCLRDDRYYGESIAVHEFAHTVHLAGLVRTVPGFNADLRRLYRAALDEGLWVDTYAGTNYKEYWAEGVQSYFGTNLQSLRPDGVHNHVNTRAELERYDPALFEFIDGIFGFEWTPTCPER